MDKPSTRCRCAGIWGVQLGALHDNTLHLRDIFHPVRAEHDFLDQLLQLLPVSGRDLVVPRPMTVRCCLLLPGGASAVRTRSLRAYSTVLIG